jgi:Arc/MetJ family transcription regulator
MKDIRNSVRRKTSVSVNSDLLDQASQILHTNTVRETIEQALIEVLRTRARAEEVRALREMSGLDLDQPAVMKQAWRA